MPPTPEQRQRMAERAARLVEENARAENAIKTIYKQIGDTHFELQLNCRCCRHLAEEVRERLQEINGLKRKLKAKHYETAAPYQKSTAPNYPDHLYIIGRFGGDTVKIGISHDPANRCKSFNDPHLRVLWTNEIGASARRFEKHCHNQLSSYRIDKTEWFRLRPEEAITEISNILLHWRP